MWAGYLSYVWYSPKSEVRILVRTCVIDMCYQHVGWLPQLFFRFGRSAAPKRVSADEPLPWPLEARWRGRCLQPRQRARARVRVSERDDDG